MLKWPRYYGIMGKNYIYIYIYIYIIIIIIIIIIFKFLNYFFSARASDCKIPLSKEGTPRSSGITLIKIGIRKP